MNILIKVGLTRLLFASGITSKPWFRALFTFGVIMFLIAIAVVVMEHESKPQPYEVLIAQENINILSDKSSEMPLFGENDEYYFMIYPATHYKTNKNNKCTGFKASVRSTWCGDEKIFPNCNPGIIDCYRNYSD